MKNYLIFSAILFLSSCSFAQNKYVVRSKSVTTSVALPSETGDFRADMLNMVNAVREQGCKCGGKKMPPVAPLTWNARLENASIAHAKDMAKNNHFDHVGTDGSEIDTRANRAGYKWMQIGENIAWGYDNVRDAMIGWIKSPSHCLQLMSDKVTEMGAARNNTYWVQDFGKQRNW
jgi:uncharacterized protein YkwD